MSKFAVEYSALQLVRDKLASADRLKRDAIGLFMTIAAALYYMGSKRYGLQSR